MLPESLRWVFGSTQTAGEVCAKLTGHVPPLRHITDREFWLLFNCDKQVIKKMQSGEFDGISAETLLAILNHLKIRFIAENEIAQWING
jgi:hypothetical protein